MGDIDVSNIRKIIILLIVLYTNTAFALITEYEFDDEQKNGFIAGQVWSYETREHEQRSKLTVLKVDYFENAVVVHVRLDNIKLLDPEAPQGFRTIVPHMAFMQTALLESVLKVLDKNIRLPEFSKDYHNWREGDGIGTAYAWHYSVSEALNGLERTKVNKHSSTFESRQN